MSGALSADHAVAMDRMYRLTRHVYDLTRKPYLIGRDRMIDDLHVPPGGSVLELGCGTGRNLIRVGDCYPGSRLFGVDISAEMLKTAEANIARAGADVHVTRGDATTFDPSVAFGCQQFDRVYFSYTLSMVPDWRAALAHGLSLTTVDGVFAVVDFGFCEGLGAVPRAALHGWLKLFHVSPRAELEAEMGALARRSGRRLKFARPFGGYAQIGMIC